MKENGINGQKTTNIGQKNSGENSFSAMKAISLFMIREARMFAGHPERRFMMPTSISVSSALNRRCLGDELVITVSEVGNHLQG